jgi:hypothetical protein
MFYRQTGWRDEQPLAMTGLDEHGLSELALKIAVCLLGVTAYLRAHALRKDYEITKSTGPNLSLPESELNTSAVTLWVTGRWLCSLKSTSPSATVQEQLCPSPALIINPSVPNAKREHEPAPCVATCSCLAAIAGKGCRGLAQDAAGLYHSQFPRKMQLDPWGWGPSIEPHRS